MARRLRLEIEEGDLVGRTQRSGLFKTMFLVFRADGARDWHTRLAIALNHNGTQHKLQFHHIFPKAYLSGDYEAKLVNDIANLAFISGGTNRKISAKSPEDYFTEILSEHGSQVFENQCVPIDKHFLAKENYRDFLNARRVKIAQRINEFVSGD